MTITAALLPPWADQKAVRAFVDHLDDTARSMLTDALTQRNDADALHWLAEEVQATLGDTLPDVNGVIFRPREYDDGYYFGSVGMVYFLDETRDPEETDFGGEIDEALTSLYHRVGADAGVAFIPATGETEFLDGHPDVLHELELWMDQQLARRAPSAAKVQP